MFRMENCRIENCTVTGPSNGRMENCTVVGNCQGACAHGKAFGLLRKFDSLAIDPEKVIAIVLRKHASAYLVLDNGSKHEIDDESAVALLEAVPEYDG